jgi:hypothetical protein
MKRRFLIIILLALSVVGFTSIDAKATFTVATFADPSNDSNNPLFTVDFTERTLNGGWANGKTGLILEFYNGHTFTDAWFTMTEVGIVAHAPGDTGGGEINFYADGSTAGPLLTINFDSGHIDYINFGANVIFDADGVEFSGSEIIPGLFSEEQYFSFGFVSKTFLPGSDDWDDGFTATATFDSSAIPEPAMVVLLGLGVLSLLRRKR